MNTGRYKLNAFQGKHHHEWLLGIDHFSCRGEGGGGYEFFFYTGCIVDILVWIKNMWYKIYFIGKLKIILIVNEIIFFLLQYCNSITWNPGPGSCLRNNSRMRGSMLSLTWVGIIFVIILHRAKIIFVIILHRAKARCKVLTTLMPKFFLDKYNAYPC